MTDLEKKFKVYYFTAIFSMLFAVMGFSYNAWRMEISEGNNNIRTAAFEVLTELSELEQIVYSAHYDQDKVEGNPRKGWVKIGLIVDLSMLIDNRVTVKALLLKKTWSNSWNHIQNSKNETDVLINDVDEVRTAIKQTLINLD